jgi:hypothetical protein
MILVPPSALILGIERTTVPHLTDNVLMMSMNVLTTIDWLLRNVKLIVLLV